MKKNWGKTLNLILSTRATRTFPSLMLILFSVAFTNKINLEIIILALSLILIYSYAGINNAIKDNDFILPKSSRKISIFCLCIALIFSSYNYILLLASISWIVLGYIYNSKSRKIILLDTSILGLTHYFIPLFFSLLLLGQSISASLKITIPIYLITWFILPLKNLKESKKDKDLNYKTIPTKYTNGKGLTLIAFLSSILMIIAYSYFNSLSIIGLEIISILYLATLIFLAKNKEEKAIKLTRLIFLVFFFTLIIKETEKLSIIFSGLLIIFIFALSLLKTK